MTAAALIEFARWWMIIGACVAAVFLTIGIDRIDEDARGAYVFRPLLVPAVLLIWPLILWRWVRIETGAETWEPRYKPPRIVHLPTAIILAVVLLVSVVAGLSIRQTWPADIAPAQLEAPQ